MRHAVDSRHRRLYSRRRQSGRHSRDSDSGAGDALAPDPISGGHLEVRCGRHLPAPSMCRRDSHRLKAEGKRLSDFTSFSALRAENSLFSKIIISFFTLEILDIICCRVIS